MNPILAHRARQKAPQSKFLLAIFFITLITVVVNQVFLNMQARQQQLDGVARHDEVQLRAGDREHPPSGASGLGFGRRSHVVHGGACLPVQRRLVKQSDPREPARREPLRATTLGAGLGARFAARARIRKCPVSSARCRFEPTAEIVREAVLTA